MITRFILICILFILGETCPVSIFAKNSAPLSTPCAILTAFPDTLQFPITHNFNVDTLSLLLRNTGDLAWLPGLPDISPNFGIFSIPSFDSTLLAPGESRRVTVQFTPSISGKDSAVITFPKAGPCGNPLAIYLRGEGGCAIISNTDPVVPNTAIGEKKDFTITITNKGNFEWVPGIAQLTENGDTCFTVVSISPATTPAGGDAVVTIEFSPKHPGQCCAELIYPYGNQCDDPQTIELCGIAENSSVAQTLSSEGFSLDQNFPNPFIDKTSFNYTTPKESEVSISLNDLNGNLVKTLIKGIVSEGNHLISFDAFNLPSGTYIYSLQSGSTKLARELILAK